jgi:aspartate kinase
MDHNASPIIVHKFGGGCLQAPSHLEHLATILKQQSTDFHHLIVVSAFGKTTNILDVLFASILRHEKEQANACFHQLRSFHLQFLNTLFPNGDSKRQLKQQLEETFEELNRIMKGIALLEDFPPRIHDRIMAFGERWAYLTVTAFLQLQGLAVASIDARELIITEDTYMEAQVLWESTQERVTKRLLPLLKTHPFVVIPGYIASTSHGRTTTLGREGSDYTAAILANLTHAKQVFIWKNVPGVLSEDPQVNPHAQRYTSLSYHEAATLSFFGAKVLHPKTIAPLAQKAIPLFIRSFQNPDDPGTTITHEISNHPKPVATTTLSPLYWIKFNHKRFQYLDAPLLQEILALLNRTNTHVLKIHSNGIKGALLVQTVQENLPLLTSLLSDSFHVEQVVPVKLYAHLFLSSESDSIPLPSDVIWIEKSEDSLLYITPLSNSPVKEIAVSRNKE